MNSKEIVFVYRGSPFSLQYSRKKFFDFSPPIQLIHRSIDKKACFNARTFIHTCLIYFMWNSVTPFISLLRKCVIWKILTILQFNFYLINATKKINVVLRSVLYSQISRRRKTQLLNWFLFYKVFSYILYVSLCSRMLMTKWKSYCVCVCVCCVMWLKKYCWCGPNIVLFFF